MNTFQLEITTPQSTAADREVISLDVPAASGRMTILAHHQPQICTLEDGPMFIDTPKGRETWDIKAGFMRIGKNRVSVALKEAGIKT